MQSSTPQTENTGRVMADANNSGIPPTSVNIKETAERKKHAHHHAFCGHGYWPTLGKNLDPAQHRTVAIDSEPTSDPNVDEIEVIARRIEAKLEEIEPELREVSLKIHGNPELAFEEK
ncbi:hypothetical protein H0H92_006510 [Tricholoma furcatifolium]|nr:hypothetical protein H0H92_006510 [Tricholoma furcatifolium]